ncbi:MAG: carbohydrate-binding family 9-like protein [Prevotellaceae bacterium]|nr:carbohydrate-binding family 9-like protein [Prevotellaceae bacterium]
MKIYQLFTLCVFSVFCGCSSSQVKPSGNIFDGLEHFFTTPENYVAAYTVQPPKIDGNIDDEVWRPVAWTNAFLDIEGTSKPLPYYATRAKMLWDKDYLYIAAYMEEKHVWANLTERDQIIYMDNDFEVFIDPANTGHNYYEFEVNAFNTMFDLFLTKPYRSGAHVLISWDSKDLKHAVGIKGTLNNPADEDEGWTVEIAIPFKDISNTPKDGDIWRLGFSRVEWDMHVVDGKYVKQIDKNGKTLPEHNWVWSPTGEINMHMPERWGYLQFSKQEKNTQLPAFEMPYKELQSKYLWLIFYRQQLYRKINGVYATSLKELHVPDVVSVADKSNTLSLIATPLQFTAEISDTSGKIIRINHEGSIN